jgi:hypothetical protein
MCLRILNSRFLVCLITGQTDGKVNKLLKSFRNQLCPKVAGDNGISDTKSKQQSPCSNCMHQPVTSWGNAHSTCTHKPVRCMHWPVTLQANACTYCMGSKVSSLSRICLYSSYFGCDQSSAAICTSH